MVIGIVIFNVSQAPKLQPKPEAVLTSQTTSATNQSSSEQKDTNDNPAESNISVSDSLININTASFEELKTLKGIGDKKAQAIIDYRTENGKFDTVEEITKVTGIGESIFSDIKDSITV